MNRIFVVVYTNIIKDTLLHTWGKGSTSWRMLSWCQRVFVLGFQRLFVKTKLSPYTAIDGMQLLGFWRRFNPRPVKFKVSELAEMAQSPWLACKRFKRDHMDSAKQLETLLIQTRRDNSGIENWRPTFFLHPTLCLSFEWASGIWVLQISKLILLLTIPKRIANNNLVFVEAYAATAQAVFAVNTVSRETVKPFQPHDKVAQLPNSLAFAKTRWRRLAAVSIHRKSREKSGGSNGFLFLTTPNSERSSVRSGWLWSHKSRQAR